MARETAILKQLETDHSRRAASMGPNTLPPQYIVNGPGCLQDGRPRACSISTLIVMAKRSGCTAARKSFKKATIFLGRTFCCSAQPQDMCQMLSFGPASGRESTASLRTCPVKTGSCERPGTAPRPRQRHHLIAPLQCHPKDGYTLLSQLD